jgi:hypothetical protein
VALSMFIGFNVRTNEYGKQLASYQESIRRIYELGREAC